ncbi:MAG: hypothetical protein CMK07_13680 [Ponticaulis sp.]|nr:hypothetical protein [Ponticaulis sp.]
MLKSVVTALAASALLAPVAMANPPAHAKDDRLPPGLEKQAKVPPGQAKKWSRGEALPTEYRTRYITDYDRYGLRRAPDGYRWVRTDTEAYLIATATGVITDVIVDAFN